MKKILFYTHFLKIGGIEKVLLIYLKNLTQFGYKVDLLVDYDLGKKNILLEQIPKNVKVNFVKNRLITKIIVSLRELTKQNKLANIILLPTVILSDFFYYHLKVKKLIKKQNYDISITFYQLLPSFLTKNQNCKHIIYNHGNLESYFLGFKRFFKNSFGKKLNKYDFIITICDEMKEQISEFYPQINAQKLKRFYNPFDFKEIIKKSKLEIIKDSFICTVLRIDESDKDLQTLILAFNKLKCKEKLYIIGDGIDKEHFIKLVKDMDLQDRILFLGMKMNPYIYIKNSKFLVHSSKSEGLSTVLIETLALNKFIICSNCKTGVKEILQNGKLGDRFEIGNIDELAQKIERALNDKNHILNKIKNQKDSLERFDEKNVMSEFNQFLKKL